MWGNALGWSISLVWVVVVAATLWSVNRIVQHVSPRTEFSRNSENAAEIALPMPPDLVVPGMSDPADAAPIYRRVIAEYQEDPIRYEDFARSGMLRDVSDVPAINILPEATHCATAKLFIDNPSQVINYDEKPDLDALQTVGRSAIRAALLLGKQDPQQARHLCEAVFSLGVKLFDERLSYAEMNAGLEMMAQGSTMIGQLAQSSGDAERAAAIKQFDEARMEYVKQHILPVMRVIGSADPATLDQYAGDVFYFARHAGDRMWRVEAILKIGRYRFNGPIGDQRSAMKALHELAKDPDPVIRTAANAAIDLTPEQYRMLR